MHDRFLSCLVIDITELKSLSIQLFIQYSKYLKSLKKKKKKAATQSKQLWIPLLSHNPPVET